MCNILSGWIKQLETYRVFYTLDTLPVQRSGTVKTGANEEQSTS